MKQSRLYEFCVVIFGLAILGVIWALMIAWYLQTFRGW